jgi:hypothetical protein
VSEHLTADEIEVRSRASTALDAGEARELASSRALVLFALALLVPPLVWFASLQTGYSLGAFACDVGRTRSPFHAVMLAALVGVAVAAAIAWRLFARSGRGSVDDDHGERHRSRFLAAVSLALGAQIALLMIAQVVAVVVLTPCS